jgi:hypothetical protein
MVAQSSEVVSRNAEAAQALDRWFYIGVGSFILALCVVGFAPSLIDQSDRAVPLPLTPTVTVHGLSAVGFLVLFIVQSWLVATRRPHIHRQLGVVTALFAALFIGTGWSTVIEGARRGFDLANVLTPRGSVVPPELQVGALFNFVAFGAIVAIAIACRRRPEAHKRWMVLALTGVVSITPLLHISGHNEFLRAHTNELVTLAWLAILCVQPIYDRLTRGRIHPVSLWGGIATVGAMIVFNTFILNTALWRAFAVWAVADG